MSKEIIDLLERILSFAAKRAEVHFQFAKEKEDDGAMFFTEDYKAYISILDDATTAIILLKQQPTVSDFREKVEIRLPISLPGSYEGMKSLCATLTDTVHEACDIIDLIETENKKLKEQPTANEFTKRVRSQLLDVALEVGGVKNMNELCKDLLEACDIIDQLQAKQPTVGEFTKDLRKLANSPLTRLKLKRWFTKSMEACDIIDTAEATKKGLLKVCEGLMEKADNGSADFDDPVPGSIYLKAKAAIAKAKKERE